MKIFPVSDLQTSIPGLSSTERVNTPSLLPLGPVLRNIRSAEQFQTHFKEPLPVFHINKLRTFFPVAKLNLTKENSTHVSVQRTERTSIFPSSLGIHRFFCERLSPARGHSTFSSPRFRSAHLTSCFPLSSFTENVTSAKRSSLTTHSEGLSPPLPRWARHHTALSSPSAPVYFIALIKYIIM